MAATFQRRSQHLFALTCFHSGRSFASNTPPSSRVIRTNISKSARLLVGTDNLNVLHEEIRSNEQGALQSLAAVDNSFRSRVVTAASQEHGRLVLSPCGELQGEADDVRKVGDAARAGAVAAFAMGASTICLRVGRRIPSTVHPADGKAFLYSGLVAELAIRQAAYIPLQARETSTKKLSPLSEVLVETLEGYAGPQTAQAIEFGRSLARDIGSGDPERMAPPKLGAHVREVCEAAGIEVSIIDDQAVLQKEYPLLMAVARASAQVPRHQPCVVRLAWQGSGPVERTICVAGKGVTYDTGGADLKTGGGMAGMRTDKCGAAAAAGFILSCSKAPAVQTQGLRVVVELGCVRNSIGSDAFVADEIITGHAGKRVLIGNTDAEGRLVLADCLSHLRTRVTADPQRHPNPCFLSLATLTGHAKLAFGPFAVANENGAARAGGGIARHIAAAGFALGDPVEVSSLRKEDFSFIKPGSHATPMSLYPGSYDVIQSNNGPSATTKRGHQFPMAFLIVASGLQEHGAGSAMPLPYCHIDIAGAVHDSAGVETGSPIVALHGHFVMRLRELI